MINAHLSDARMWINYAEPLVRAFDADPASMTPLDRNLVSSVLAANFHTTSPGYVHIIATNMNALRTAINGSLEISCRDPAICANHPDYLGASPYNPRAEGYSGSFTLCGAWFETGTRYLIRVSTILHETAHARVGLGSDEDHYEDVEPDVYRDLPPETAIDNPDSYAATARQIFHRGSYGPNLVVMPGEPPRTDPDAP